MSKQRKFSDVVNLSDMLVNDNKNQVLEIPLDSIKLDNEQPRKYFDDKELFELSESIAANGLLTPVSVRQVEDGYILNYGERRYKAHQLLKAKTIKAIIDNNYNENDKLAKQLIENIQRSNLNAFEISAAIQELLNKGKKKGEIAEILGKSNAFISQYINFSKLPDILSNLYRDNKCSDITLLNELNTLYKKYKDDVIIWINSDRDINRSNVKMFREYLENKPADVTEESANQEYDSAAADDVTEESANQEYDSAAADDVTEETANHEYDSTAADDVTEETANHEYDSTAADDVTEETANHKYDSTAADDVTEETANHEYDSTAADELIYIEDVTVEEDFQIRIKQNTSNEYIIIGEIYDDIYKKLIEEALKNRPIHV